MQRAAATKLEAVLTDGGASKNDWLMQFQAGLLDRQVLRSQTAELSGLGAAFAAGVRSGVLAPAHEGAKMVGAPGGFRPRVEGSRRKRRICRRDRPVATVQAH